MAPFAPEGCKLFVYGISQHISNSELQEEFEKFGTVNDTYNTGKGYAFVTYDSPEEEAVEEAEATVEDVAVGEVTESGITGIEGMEETSPPEITEVTEENQEEMFGMNLTMCIVTILFSGFEYLNISSISRHYIVSGLHLEQELLFKLHYTLNGN